MTLKLIIVFSFLIFSAVQAQWIQQNSGTNQNLYDIEFINPLTGWALGDGGIIIKTTNSGLTWINVPNPAIGKPLSSIQILDSTNIFVVGWFETIIKSTDAGLSWIVIRNGPFGQGSSYEGVYFLDTFKGFICGSGQKLLRTINGGQTFDSLVFPSSYFYDIEFINYNTGLLLEEGNVYKTTNGALSWFNTNVPNSGVTSFWRKLGIGINNSVCVAGTNAVIYWSSNYGDTWSARDTIPNTGIIAVDLLNNTTGFVGGGNNKLFKTTDAGFTWKQENTGTGVVAFIASIRFINELTGWYTGGAGRIFHTTTGGLTPIINNSSVIPEYNLLYNYPNPFNPTTKISYSLKIKQLVEINIYDSKGNLIKNQINKIQEPGTYTLEFNGNELSSGVYFYSLVLDGKTVKVNKMVLMK